MAKEMTQKEMISQVHQAVIGIPDNDDENGLIGDVADIKKHLKEQNSRIGRTERSVSRIKGIGAGVAVVITLAGVVVGVIQLT